MIKSSVLKFFKKNIYYLSPQDEVKGYQDKQNYKRKRLEVAFFFLLVGFLPISISLFTGLMEIGLLIVSLGAVFIGLIYLTYLLFFF